MSENVRIRFKVLKQADQAFLKALTTDAIEQHIKNGDTIVALAKTKNMEGETGVQAMCTTRNTYGAPEIESEERATKLARAWWDVLKDIAVKCRDGGELRFIASMTEVTFPSLIKAKEEEIELERAEPRMLGVPFTVRGKLIKVLDLKEG